MKKLSLILLSLLCSVGLYAQNYNMNLHKTGSTIYTEDVTNISTIRFEGHDTANMLINVSGTINTFSLNDFDSITFSLP